LGLKSRKAGTISRPFPSHRLTRQRRCAPRIAKHFADGIIPMLLCETTNDFISLDAFPLDR
jgi:hypothetical protein